MGTNYYAVSVGQGVSSESRIHIGKSSFGWTFALHIHPELRIFQLSDWEAAFQTHDIYDEYVELISAAKMMDIITNRSFERKNQCTHKYLVDNQAEVGPNGLLRRRLSNHVLYHGEGTWDCIVGGEFF